MTKQKVVSNFFLISALISLSLYSSGCVYRKLEKVELYDSGIRKSQGWLVGGKRSGEWIFFHPNSQISEIFYYDNGLENGKVFSFAPDGQITASGFFREGKKEGMWVFWHNNGIISGINYYKEDKLEGRSILFYSNGLKRATGQYLNGEKTGRWTYYEFNGDIKSVQHY